jgi:hypothetical protein
MNEQLRQSYETTIANAAGDRILHLFSLPSRSFPQNAPYVPSSVFSDFNFVEAASVDAAYLAHAIAVILDYQLPSGTVPSGPKTAANDSDLLRALFVNASNSQNFALAEQIAFGRVVPFETSPLTAEVLASIVAGSSTVGVGAKLGILAFGAVSGPALLVAAAAGIVVVVASVEIGKGVGKQLMGLK